MRKMLVLLVLLGQGADALTRVKVTAYSSGHTTATGTRVRPGVVALSRNLLRTYPYGSRVQIKCGAFKRNYRVEDTMASRWRNKADIYMTSHVSARNWGVKSCTIRKL